MMDCFQEQSEYIRCLKFHTGCIDTGMTSECFPGKHFLVNKKLHLIVRVVDETHDRRRSRRYIQQSLHILPGSKGKSGGWNLRRKFFCLQVLASRHYKQIVFCFLPVTQEQILTYFNPESLIHFPAGFNSSYRFVVYPLISDTKAVQNFIYFLFPFLPALKILRSSLI